MAGGPGVGVGLIVGLLVTGLLVTGLPVTGLPVSKRRLLDVVGDDVGDAVVGDAVGAPLKKSFFVGHFTRGAHCVLATARSSLSTHSYVLRW